jgi:hypothetical protein
MNKISISRILSTLCVVSIPFNAFFVVLALSMGGLSSIDSRGFMSLGIILIFFFSIILTIISWIKIIQISAKCLTFSLLALLFCILPLVSTMILGYYNDKVWEQQKTLTFPVQYPHE